MTLVAGLYPEFDAREIADVIAPLSDFDDSLLASLMKAVSTPPPARVEAGPESYPFQAIVTAIADEALLGRQPWSPHLLAPDAARLTRTQLAERLHAIYVRPLTASLNEARLAGALSGGTPQARYQDFVTRWPSDFAPALHAEYPVVAMLRDTIVAATLRSLTTILQRLDADWDALVAFLGAPATCVVDVSWSGDTHHGDCVSILTLDSGARVAYKPRSIDGEAGFRALVCMLAEHSPFRLLAPRVLARDGYGYVEFIRAEQKVAAPDADFARCCGELSAFLYCVNARDMHVENLVPTGAGPIPIDLETLLHPARQLDARAKPEISGNAHQLLAESVYGVGVLPLIVLRSEESGDAHIDVGFLGSDAGAASPYRSLRLLNPYSDEMRVALLADQPSAATRPGFRVADEAGVRRLAAGFAEGFAAAYDWIGAHRELLWRLVVETLGDARLRYVHNPTMLYAQTLRMGTSTAALRSRDAYLGVLKRIGIASKGVSSRLVASEVAQLATRDVPYFTVMADGLDVANGFGVPTGARLERTPLQQVRAKLEGLGPTDRELQLTMIHSAFTAQFPDNHFAEVRLRGNGLAPLRPRVPAAALAALAREVGDSLAENACWDRYGHLPKTWVGPLASASVGRPWPPGVLGYDLYAGRTGLALALAALGRALDEPSHLEVAGQVFDASAAILTAGSYELRSLDAAGIGAYSGVSGLLYALAEAGRILDRPDWVDAARRSVPVILDLVEAETDAGWDVIRGRLGAIAALHVASGPEVSTRLAAGLIAALGDVLSLDRDPTLDQSGFAHGVSGALFCASRWLAPGAARSATLHALVERLDRHFDPAAGDWRTSVRGTPRFATGWCHGSAGIALGLAAAALAEPDDPQIAARLDIALVNLRDAGFGRNLTQCHGDLGNRDVVAWMADHTDEAPLAHMRAQIDAELTPDRIRRRASDRTSRYAHTSSLMVGRAGVALHLANRLAPDLHLTPLAMG